MTLGSFSSIPELLAPAGSLDAVRAAIANGANAVYLGAQRFNARDDGAQLTLEELATACTLAHSRGVRIYLTLNVLIKPRELEDALELLGEAIDRGIDAAIVQDLGLIRLIRHVYPEFEVHGSTQLTVHDVSGARLIRDLGVERVVLARENTIEDIRAIRSGVDGLGLEAFVHGALCISYSGQCLMSGMISERSANRGSCAQSCRKEYVLRDADTGSEIDRGFVISAKDLAAHDQLAALADAGISCLKVEGRKKKPEYVAVVTRGYRTFLDRLQQGQRAVPEFEEIRPLVQIYSRGNTAGMLVGRAGRSYITRAQPDNRGHEIGRVVGRSGAELLVEVSQPIRDNDGLGFEPPVGMPGESRGFAVRHVRTLRVDGGTVRQALTASEQIPVGWRVVRNSDVTLSAAARATFDSMPNHVSTRRLLVNVRLFGDAGAPLKAVWTCGEHEVTTRTVQGLAPAREHGLSDATLREQLGRLGSTPFVLGTVDAAGLAAGLFAPLSALNQLRTEAVAELLPQVSAEQQSLRSVRAAAIAAAVHRAPSQPAQSESLRIVATVCTADDARAAAQHGATEIVFDPFLRHPVPPRSRVAALSEELQRNGVAFRLRTPTIVRPEERAAVDRWLDLGTPIQSGHLGLVVELARAGRDVVADYAVNVFNSHSAELFFERRVTRIVASVELTLEELSDLALPWRGARFDLVVYGRPEGMTIEHCVLSAAFDRVATTCRDLCVSRHRNTELTDPAGYTFPVATDSACRNRLLHSRPIDGSEFALRLWDVGFRGFQLLFNVPNQPVGELVGAYRTLLEGCATGARPDASSVRSLLGGQFTRGHFVRAV